MNNLFIFLTSLSCLKVLNNISGVSLAIFLVHDIHAFLMLIPGQDPESLYVAPDSTIIYNAYLLVPLRLVEMRTKC